MNTSQLKLSTDPVWSWSIKRLLPWIRCRQSNSKQNQKFMARHPQIYIQHVCSKPNIGSWMIISPPEDVICVLCYDNPGLVCNFRTCVSLTDFCHINWQYTHDNIHMTLQQHINWQYNTHDITSTPHLNISISRHPFFRGIILRCLNFK